MKNLINRLLFKYIHQQWNIAIADIGNDLSPSNVHWIRHNYSDRWFADPFIIDEDETCFIVLVEEYMQTVKRGRVARLTISKGDFSITNNETILDLPTHLSFPNTIKVNEKIYLYPENGASGHTLFYNYGDKLEVAGKLSELPLSDAVIHKFGDSYYLFFTIGDQCNGKVLTIYRSSEPFGNYQSFQEFTFSENIARRAGKIFIWGEKLISPAQVCNNQYGEGVSLQEVSLEDDKFKFVEIKRIYPFSDEYNQGLHTYNTFGSHVIIDGYKFRCLELRKLYFKTRGINEY